MHITFSPKYTITPKMAFSLMRLEAAKERLQVLKLPDSAEETTKETLQGYSNALAKAVIWAANGNIISEKMIPTLHALMMGDGQSKIKPSTYREGSLSEIVNGAPYIHEVPERMKALADWINKSVGILPHPIIAAITYFECVKIQPYTEGSQDLAKLLSTIILHVGGYVFKNSKPMEDFTSYESDLTQAIENFIVHLEVPIENLIPEIEHDHSKKSEVPDKKELSRSLNIRQRKALKLFKDYATISATQIGEQFNLKPRTRAQLCKDWVDAGFLEVVDFSNKARKYKLTDNYEILISKN